MCPHKNPGYIEKYDLPGYDRGKDGMPYRMFVDRQCCFEEHGQCIHPMDHSSILLRRQEITVTVTGFIISLEIVVANALNGLIEFPLKLQGR